ncbi:MAG: ABC transporter permease [Pseudomonadota bacterium]|nr:ABC transporter permease [Pseudomonadota bacterium]
MPITVVLGFVVGVAIVGLTFSLFIRDNIKQFGALKAIGVNNGKLGGMVAAQAGLVGMIGYGLGVLGTVAFIWGFSTNPTFKGFYIPWQVPTLHRDQWLLTFELQALRQLWLSSGAAEVLRHNRNTRGHCTASTCNRSFR